METSTSRPSRRSLRVRRNSPRAGFPLVGALFLGLFASACGGGGGGGGGNGTPPTAPQNLSYPARLVILELDEALAPLQPTVTGTVSSYTVEPALPAGLVLDPVSGVISGAPSAIAPRTRHTLRASNAGGYSETTLEVLALGRPRFALLVNELDSTHSRFALEGGDGGRMLHAGYHAQPAPQLGPREIVLHPGGLFAFTVDAQTDTVSVHAVDPANGQLATGAPLAAGPAPHHLAVHPEGTFLYVASAGGDALRTFSIDPATGALTAEDTLAVPSGVLQLLVDPLGRFLISVHSGTNALQSYPLDPQSGLPSLGDARSLATAVPVRAALDAHGAHLYLTVANFGLVVRYPVISDAGTLGTSQNRQVGGTPTWLALHPEGRFLYVVRAEGTDLRRYTVDPATGVLTIDTDFGDAPASSRLSFEERGRWAHSIDAANQQLAVLEFDPTDGALVEVQRVGTRREPRAIVVLRGASPLARTASQLYVVQTGAGSLRTFDVESDGDLSLNAVDVPTGILPLDLALDPRHRWAFALTQDEVRTLEIQSDGSLADTGLFVPTGTNPAAITVEPSARFLYLVDRTDGVVTRYEIGVDGSLTAGAPLATEPQPRSLRVDPTGQYLVIGTDGTQPNAQEGSVTPYRIDPLDGSLTLSAPSAPSGPAPGFPSRIAFDSQGLRAYATLLVANSTVPYTFSLETGALAPVAPGTNSQTEPFDVLVTGDRRFGFVALRNPSGPGRVNAYDVRASDGALRNETLNNFTPKQSFTDGLLNARRLALTPDDATLYVLSEGTSEVRILTIDADGLLSTFGVASTASLPLDMELRIVLE